VILAASPGLADKKDEEGKALLDRAVQLSDIRAEGAPAFRLKASFKVIKEDLSVTEGTYTEIWATPVQWRTETILGDFSRTVVANGKKRWTLNSSSTMPTGIGEVAFPYMTTLKSFPELWKPRKIEDRQINSLPARCIDARLGSPVGTGSLCFDKSKGMLVAKVVRREVAGKIVENTCEYSDYQKFGEKFFPRAIHCFAGSKPKFEETLLELAPQSSLDAASFAPLEGGTESAAGCQGIVKAPHPVYTPDPAPISRDHSKNTVVLWLTVGTDGETHDVRVARSVDEASDKAAMEAVRRWRFKPATCDGEPIATHINVEINVHVF
jgi:TonB family protein